MAKIEFESDAHQLVCQQFEEFADGTIETRKQQEKARRYRDGDQYTDTERKTLKARKQPIITDNKIQDKCDTLLGIEKQQRTDPKAFPRNPSDEDMNSAEAATDALRYIADSSDYKLKARKGAADNLMVEGVCFGQVVIDTESKNRKVGMERIRQDRGYYDVRSQEYDFSDKRYCGYFTWMDEEEVVGDWPKSKDMLSNATVSDWASEDAFDDKPRYILSQSKRKRIQVFTHYYIHKGQWHECKWVRGGFLEEPKPCVYKDEDSKPSCPMEIQALYRDSDGNPYGVVQRYMDLQDEHNKRRSKMLHLLTAKRVKMRRGVVENINTLRAEIHKPDGVIEIDGSPEDLVVEDNLAEADGQWRLMQQTEAALASTGPNAALAGISGDISGIAKARDQQAGQLPISPLFDALDSWELRMYRQAWLRVRQFWNAETWVRVTDNEDSPKWVGLNQPVTNGEQQVMQLKNDPQFQQLPEDQKLAQIQQIAAVPDAQRQAIGQDGKLMKRNVPGEIDVDIVIDRSPDVATLQMEEFQTLAELAKTRPEVSFKTLLKLSGVRSSLKREVMDELESGANPMAVQQAMQQVQVQAQELQQVQAKMQQDAQKLQEDQSQLQAVKAEAEAAIAKVQTEEAQLAAERAQFDAYIAQQQAALAKDAVGLQVKSLQFDGKQLDSERQQLEQTRSGSEKEKADTGGLIEQIGATLASFQDQISSLAEVTQSPSRPKQFRIQRGPNGLSGQVVESGENGETVTRNVTVQRNGGEYTGTIQ